MADSRTGTTQYPSIDFPFYNGRPARISGAQWLLVMAMVAIGFLALIAPIPLFKGGWAQFIPAILFFAVPLAGLAMVAPHHWTAIFRKVGWREVMWMVAFALLNIAVSMGVGLLVYKFQATTGNPVFGMLAGEATGDRLLFFLKTLPQLFGEELLTILPFLALAWLFHSKFKMARLPSIALAWLLSAVLFGLAHLPTYGWNLVQCLVVIGSARLVLTLAYLKTKNIWVSFGAHVINDWTLFGAGLLMGGMAHGA